MGLCAHFSGQAEVLATNCFAARLSGSHDYRLSSIAEQIRSFPAWDIALYSQGHMTDALADCSGVKYVESTVCRYTPSSYEHDQVFRCRYVTAQQSFTSDCENRA